MTDKKIHLDLVGINGNAFSLMGAFQSQARKEGWTSEEIKEVLDEAKSGDYDHVLATIDSHCISPNDEDLPDMDEEVCDRCGLPPEDCECDDLDAANEEEEEI